jgi:hypothetical protein
VIARLERWSGRPARRELGRDAALAAAVGVALFLGTFALLHIHALGAFQIIDTPVYQRYGEAVTGGAVPYRDFGLEYPPGALPVFILPALAPSEDYRTLFELLMALCGALAVLLVVATLAAVGASTRRLVGAAVFAGLAPLALGTVILTRYDLWPAFLTVAAVAAIVSGRDRLGAGVLAVAVAAKVYPFVLLPLALVWAARRKGWPEAVVCGGVFVLVLGAILLPFAILSPDGLAVALERQTGRPLQVESLGASFLFAAHQLGWYEPTVVSSYGSQNLLGSAPDALATAQTVVQALAIVGAWLLYAALRRSGPEQLLAAGAAVAASFVAFGKVLSPQYLIWLVPLVPLVAGGFGLAASGLLLAAMILTHLWFPSRYWDFVFLEGGPAWLVLARDLVLVALAALLWVAIRRVSGRPRSP